MPQIFYNKVIGGKMFKKEIMMLFFILVLFVSCFDSGSGTGTLQFSTSMNVDLAKENNQDTCNVVDLIWKFASFEVSTQQIIAGAPDTLEWFSVYSDTSESRLTEFSFETEIEAGSYKTLRLAMRNRNWWEIEYGDTVVLVEDWNRDSSTVMPDDTPYSYYDDQGCWYCDNGTFVNVAPLESVSEIVISDGSYIDMVMNWNMYQLVIDQDLHIRDWIIREGHHMIEWKITP
jgi:hypothetical protein